MKSFKQVRVTLLRLALKRGLSCNGETSFKNREEETIRPNQNQTIVRNYRVLRENDALCGGREIEGFIKYF